MDTNTRKTDFSIRDLSFLLDQVNRSRMLGLSIDPASVVKADGAVRFRAAYWGERGLADFVAPINESLPDRVVVKSILQPTTDGGNKGWSQNGMSLGGHKVVLWVARPEENMVLTTASRDGIRADFELKPWPTQVPTKHRDPEWVMRSRIRQWSEGRNSVAEVLANSLVDDTVVTRPVGPGMR